MNCFYYLSDSNVTNHINVFCCCCVRHPRALEPDSQAYIFVLLHVLGHHNADDEGSNLIEQG